MKYKNFSTDIWNQIKLATEKTLQSDKSPIAAFDADGTLWDIDMGETFFKYQIEKKLVANLPPNPWQHYHNEKENKDPRLAYLWLAQINKGYRLEQIQKWAEEAILELKVIPIFEEQKKLINYFLDHGVRIYIITASIAWAVEPAAQRLNLSNENVLGVRCLVKDGIITDKQDGVITYKEGKTAALLNQTHGKKPFFACGNSMGDFDLLSNASLALAVRSAQENDELFETEDQLYREAQKRNWLTHQF